MASPLFFFFFFITTLTTTPFVPLSLSSSVVEDLANLQPPPDFNATISANCQHNPLLRYCNASSQFDILEVFRSTIVGSHLCNESKNPNCVESFPMIRLHSRPKTAKLYLSFTFFWKYCPLSVASIQISNNSLTGGFPTDVLSCSQIQSLDLSYNDLSGDAPLQALSALPNLTHLNLSYNRFSENKMSDSQFFKRFNASSFIRSGILLNARRYKIKFFVLLIGLPLLVILISCCFGWLCFNRPDYLPKMLWQNHKFTPAMLEAATEEFSEENLVTKGRGFDIYRGTLRDGTDTRIEVYRDEISREKSREFAEECKVVVNLRHKNMVRVLGWCNSRNTRALITEWIDGQTIETWLSSLSAMSWGRRVGVVMGVVEGMYYLHDQWPEVIYDLTTSSVLLSDEQEPLISQFKVGDGSNSTNIYRFGLFLLEMVTNLRPDTEQDGAETRYVEYIRVHYPGNLERVMDERMKLDKRAFEQAKQVITLGLMCTDKPPAKQPSLTQIYTMVASLHESCSRHHGNKVT